jgi:hypothetical protein
MRRLVVVSLLGIGALLATLEPALAQSGVISGPPMVDKGPGIGAPNFGPGPGPNYGPRLGQPGEPDRRNDGAWIAVSGGFDLKGKNVGVGFSGVRYSQLEAENAAIGACNARGKGIKCQQAFAVANGCLYIVPGSGARGVTWGRGATPEIALQECRRDGYACDRGEVVGGCISGYGN